MSDQKLSVVIGFKGIDGLSSTLRTITGVGGVARDKMKALKNEVNATEKALKENRAEFSKIGLMGGPIGHLVEKEKSLTNELQKQNALLERQKAKMDRVSTAQNLGGKMRDSGMGHIQSGIGVSLALGGLGKMGMDFEDGMTDIRLKADLTAEATEKMKKSIFQAAREAKQMPNDMRLGVDTLMGKGLDENSSLKIIAPIGKAATAYNASIDDLSNASYAALDNLKVPANQIGLALDAMALSGKRGSFEMKDMAQYFPSLTGQAKSFGQTGVAAVADLGAALQIARKDTGDSSTAANNIKNLLAKINTEETEKKFAKFGINLPAAMKKAHDEGKTPLEAIAELTNKATKGDTKQISKLWGDMEAQSGVRSLIQNMQEYKDIRADALKAGGTVNADFEIRSKGGAAAWRSMMGSFTNIGVNIGSTLLPALVPFVDKVSEISDKFAKFTEKHPRAIKLIGMLAGGFALGSFALGGFQMVLGATITPWVKFANLFIAAPGGISKAARAFGLLKGIGGGILKFGLTLGRVGLMLLTNPFFIGAAAIGVAAYLIWKNWDKVKKWGVGAINWIKTTFAKIKGFVRKNPLAPLVFGIAGAAFSIYANWDKIKKAFTDAMDKLKKLDFKTIGLNLIQGLINGVINGIPGLRSAIGVVTSIMKDKPKEDMKIKSPSRITTEYGKFYTLGFSTGINRHAPSALNAARHLANGLTAAGAISSAALAGDIPTLQARPTSVSHGKVEIHIHATPNQSANDIAAEVDRILKERERRAQTNYNSRF